MAAPSQGTRGARTAGLLLFALGFGIFAIYYAGFKGGRPTFWPDTYEYAEVARNVARGQGIQTSTVSFAEFWLLGRHPFPLPYLLHDCGNSLLMAGSFLVLGVYDGAVGWGTGLAFACLPPLAFALGSRLFGWTVGLVAAFLVLVHVQLLAFAAAGLSEVPYALALTLVLVLVSRPSGSLRSLFTGLAFGATVGLRSNSLPFLPWLLLFLALEPREDEGASPWTMRLPGLRVVVRRWVPFLLGFAVLFVPIAARNQHWLGRPLYNVAALDGAYGLDVHGAVARNVGPEDFQRFDVPPDPGRSFVGPAGRLPERMLSQIRQSLADLLDGGVPGQRSWADAVLFFLFLFGAVSPPREETRQTWFRWLVYALILTALGVGSLIHLRWRHLYGFLPAVMIYDAEVAVRLIDPSGTASARRRAVATAGFLLLVIAFGASRIIEDTSSPGTQMRTERRQFLKQVGTFLRQETPEDAVVLVKSPVGQGDLRPALSWYADRLTVELNAYTLANLTAKALSRPLFMLATFDAPKSEAPHPSMRIKSPPEGFAPFAAWQEGETRVVLLRQTH